MRTNIRALLLTLLFCAPLSAQQPPMPPVRVYVEAIHGHKIVAGVDHPIPVPDAALHNQQMELAKTFLQRCPDVLPTVNKEKADYIVTLNWAPATRIFLGGKLIHKPDQIMLTNRDGDVLYSNVARSVGGDVDAVCRIINRAGLAGGPTAQTKNQSATQVTKDQERINQEWGTRNSPANAADPPRPSQPAEPPEKPQQPNLAEHSGGTWLGASSLDKPMVRHNGVTLYTVERHGPAYDAGLQGGDVILQIDGTYFYTVEDLAEEIQKHAPGSKIAIEYLRGASINHTYVILGKQARF